MKRINALTIAGTDPSGGAGIQADLKTFSALGAYGCSVITALVAQNTRGVQSVYRIEPDFVAAQLDSVFSDVRIDTTKIGMLAETDIVEAVAERLQRYQIQNVVLDTVMLAKSGDPLLSPSAVATLRSRLLPQVSLITPNLPEAAALLDTIGYNFLDSLTAKGLNPNKITVTSVLRTKDDVKRLRRRNGNASENSAHFYGTTFDVSWKRFQKVEDEDGRPLQDVSSDTLKLVLSEVLRDLKKADKKAMKRDRSGQKRKMKRSIMKISGFSKKAWKKP